MPDIPEEAVERDPACSDPMCSYRAEVGMLADECQGGGCCLRRGALYLTEEEKRALLEPRRFTRKLRHGEIAIEGPLLSARQKLEESLGA